MSTHAEILETFLGSPEQASYHDTLSDDPVHDSFAVFEQEQLRSLVRRVFFPGWPRPARQVVLSPIDTADGDTTAVRIAHTMATEIPGNIGVIEISPVVNLEEKVSGRSLPQPVDFDQRPAALRMSSRQLSANLWLVPYAVFLGENHERLSASWLRSRLNESRSEFDYVPINAPPVNRSSEAALLGSLTDGVILTITANATRRVAAQKSQSILRQANARLLGTILCERKFPIPERLYQKL